jgi:transcriptional regulator with XRE-family HTH domain
MRTTSKSVGNKIAAGRKNINFSQADLAERVSVSAQAVGKWERGESMPDITTLNRLAEILGVDLNYFSESFRSADTEVIAYQLEKHDIIRKPKWDMSQGNWADADFSGLKNLQEKFGSSNMKNCRFAGSEMSGLVLKANCIDSCDFSDSDLCGSKIHGWCSTKYAF